MAFFGHHNGILRTEDGGRTWTPLVERRGFDAMSLATGRANPRFVYLAGHDIFRVSADGGATWQPVAHDLPGTDIHAFAVHPDDPQRLHAFVVGHGVLASGDGGGTWQKRPGHVPQDVTALASAGGNPETLYAGSGRAGPLRSGDGGRSWTPLASGGELGGVAVLAVDPASRQTVYAGGGKGLFKTTDGGATWATLPYPGRGAVALAVSPVEPHRVLAIAAESGQGRVYRSDDGGHSWAARR